MSERDAYLTLYKSLLRDVDMVIENPFGERVWLKASIGPDGKRNGITDCCLAESPCDHHRAVAAQMDVN